nr:sel1 repeat family protein [Sphingomonas sp. Y57]
MGSSLVDAPLLRANDSDTLLDLGFVYSTGSNGCPVDLVTAHKWFNLAALAGSQEAQYCRTDIAGQMSAREVAEAQRQARAWLADRALH